MSFLFFKRKQLQTICKLKTCHVLLIVWSLFFRNVSYSILSNLFVHFLRSAFLSPLSIKPGRRDGAVWSFLRLFSHPVCPLRWHISAPTCNINYVNMQENNVNMQDNYVYLQNKYVYMQVTNLFGEPDFYIGKITSSQCCHPKRWQGQDRRGLDAGYMIEI